MLIQDIMGDLGIKGKVEEGKASIECTQEQLEKLRAELSAEGYRIK